MSISAPDADSTQVYELHQELTKLIKSDGLKKAINKLRSLNNSREEEVNIDTYELIIRTVIQVYGVSEKQLYEDKGKFVATDARRTVYVLLGKYLNYTQANIAVQFAKSREAIKWSMMEFNKMINDTSNTIAPPILDFRKKHTEADRIVENTISTINKSVSNPPPPPTPPKSEKPPVVAVDSKGKKQGKSK